MEDVVLNRDFWRGRRVLVTGHTGFKGSWLSLWLVSLGADVVGYSADVPTEPSLFELASVGETVTHLVGDVRDRRRLTEAVDHYRPEVVMHMAAQALVRRSYQNPVETFETNVIGTVNVLEASQDGVRVVVIVTSDKCYLGNGPVPHREDDPKGGHDPYSASKACAEIATDAYRSAFFADTGPALASARAGNVIGGGDWAADRLVGDIMAAALNHRPAVIRNPAAVRPWQHVLNALDGYLLLAQQLWDDRSLAGGWNFGPTPADERPVREIVERIAELWGDGIAWVHDEKEQPHERHELRLDSSRARERLGWAPCWKLERAIERIVEWYRAYEAGEDMREVVLEQIKAYESAGSISSPVA
jgi:CDP-glucose 4,6-dehydratase